MSLLGRLFDFTRSRDLPHLSRPNFELERLHMLGWGVFAGIVEGNTSSIVAAKTFGASPLLVTVVYATPMLAHVLAVVWGVVMRGRPRQRTFLWLSAACVCTFASVALTPAHWHPWGGWIFALQVGLARVFSSGLVNVRISMWAVNYPAAHRARITGRLQGVRFLTGIVAMAVAARLFDADPDLYRWVYPAIGVIGVLSLLPAGRMRIRGERRELERFRVHQARRGAADGASGRGLLAGLGEALAILRRDRDFARYCQAQYLLGSAALMMDAILTIVISSELGVQYLGATLLLDLIPQATLLLQLPYWSGHFDRHGVLRFRVVNSAVWLAACVLATAAMLTWRLGLGLVVPLGLLVLSRLFNGSARAGGAIAWNLGHLHFAGKHDADLYMGIHVTLTGVRGIIMPFVGLLAYRYAGWAAMLGPVLLAAVGLWLFERLARDSGGASAAMAAREETLDVV